MKKGNFSEVKVFVDSVVLGTSDEHVGARHAAAAAATHLQAGHLGIDLVLPPLLAAPSPPPRRPLTVPSPLSPPLAVPTPSPQCPLAPPSPPLAALLPCPRRPPRRLLFASVSGAQYSSNYNS